LLRLDARGGGRWAACRNAAGTASGRALRGALARRWGLPGGAALLLAWSRLAALVLLVPLVLGAGARTLVGRRIGKTGGG